MTSTCTATAEITADNAEEALRALEHQEIDLYAELRGAEDAAVRVPLFKQLAANMTGQAAAWEQRLDLSSAVADAAASCRGEARFLAAAGEIEQVRAEAAERGRELPDPAPIIETQPEDDAMAVLLALYIAAANAA